MYAAGRSRANRLVIVDRMLIGETAMPWKLLPAASAAADRPGGLLQPIPQQISTQFTKTTDTDETTRPFGHVTQQPDTFVCRQTKVSTATSVAGVLDQYRRHCADVVGAGKLV